MFRMITDHKNIFFYDIGRCSVTYSLKWAIKSHRNWVLNKTATLIVLRQTWFSFPSKSSRNIGESEGRRKHRRILFRAREKKTRRLHRQTDWQLFSQCADFVGVNLLRQGNDRGEERINCYLQITTQRVQQMKAGWNDEECSLHN